MKTLVSLVFLTIFSTATLIEAQDPAAVLDRAVAEYRKTTEELVKRRQAGMKQPATGYLDALDATAKLAEKGGSTLVTSAIERERKIVREAGELPKKATADLPRQVLAARRKYVAGYGQVTKFLSRQEEDAKKRFLRELETSERRATLDKDEALLARIAAEKKKLAGGPDTDKGFGKNLLRNADFTAGPAGPGLPPEWDNHEGRATVEKEDGKAFLNLTGNAISQLVSLPPGTKRIQVSLRLRAPDLDALDLPGAHRAGVHLYLEDAVGKLISSQDIEITRREKKWKDLETDAKVSDGVSQVRLMIFREGIEGALHADSVTLMALER